jgi:import inner membrane translocase subunit TIM10
MAQTCAKKCIVRYTDGELAVGEMACIDRCVGKYMQAQEKVGQVLTAFEKQMAAQAAGGLPSNVPKFGK